MSRGYRLRTDRTLLFILLVGCGLLLFPPPPLCSGQAEVLTKVRHKPIPYFVSGNRIAIDARVTEPSGIDLVRCYFKGDMQAEYVFVPMTETGGDGYQAILPAPADDARQLQYLFLVVTRNQQVVRTQEFLVEKSLEEKDVPAWQEVGMEERLVIYTELPMPPEVVGGFSDSVTIDAVESSLRFGMVAGIYSTAASAGSATGTAASAANAGSITATGTGGTYTTIGLATIAGVAAGAGAIAAAGGDSEGGKERINPNARISWGDENLPREDAYQAFFRGKDLGVAYSGIHEKIGLPVGTHDLTIRALSISGDVGNVIIELGGGAYFDNDGSTRKRASLAEGESVVFPVFVPDIGSARIRW